MKINVTDSTNFKPNFSQKFFLDTNVWLYLFYPQHSHVAQVVIDKYSTFFREILTKKCLITTDNVQLSEMFNLILQLEFKIFKASNPAISFKEFRKSPDGLNSIENAKILTEKIIKFATLRSINISNEELIDIVSNCDKADFNDLYFAYFCEKEEAFLVTHDFDFHSMEKNINVISANNKFRNFNR